MAKRRPAIGFAAHTITVKQMRQDCFFNLSDFDNGNDLFPILKSYLNNLATVEDDEANGKLFRTIRVEDNVPRYLTGIVESGEYGVERTIFNRKTKAQKGALTKDDSGLLPFYFLFYLPEGQTEGIVLLQTFKQFGIQSTLMSYLKESFKKEFPQLRLTSQTITDTDLVNELVENSKITELSFIQRQLPDDVADEVYKGIDKKHRKVGSIKLSIKAAYNSTIPWKKEVAQMFSGKLSPHELLRLEMPLEPDIVSVKLNFNGRYRTVSYGEGIDLTPIFDVTDKITSGNNGNPLYESLDETAKELLTDLLKHDSEGKAQ